ncbi:MAG: hypothetical protein KAS04_06280 [Candidatus Aenigmarchaeota archaeon]|nr:hypothetical protein [Candidatus Aenigmarchaeota archaeon]
MTANTQGNSNERWRMVYKILLAEIVVAFIFFLILEFKNRKSNIKLKKKWKLFGKNN